MEVLLVHANRAKDQKGEVQQGCNSCLEIHQGFTREKEYL